MYVASKNFSKPFAGVRRSRPFTGGRTACLRVHAVDANKQSLPIPWDQVRGIVFDIDGTLTASDSVHFGVFVDLLQEIGFNDGQPISREYYDDVISGRTVPEAVKDMFPEWSEEQRNEFIEKKTSMYRERARSKLERIDGLTAFLEKVDERGLKKVSVTNAPPENAKFMLECIGLENYFDDIVFAAKLENPKPAPDPYCEGMQRMKLDVNTTLVFEDSPPGLGGAVSAGLKTIGVATTRSREELQEAGADLVVNNYNDVLELLSA